MASWAVNFNLLPAPERPLAWEEAMQRLRLRANTPHPRQASAAQISWINSAQGTEFAHLRAGPQSLAGRTTHQPPGTWLGVVLDGEASLNHDGTRTLVPKDSICFGPIGTKAALNFTTDFRLLLITFPGRLLAPRMAEPVCVGVSRPTVNSAMQSILLEFLHAVARYMDDLTLADLRFLEAAGTELLIGSLQGSHRAQPQQGSKRSALRRLYHAIEERLDGPELCINDVAKSIGLSPRYIQKLLSHTDETFTQYVMRRRLLRCHADLANPSLAGLSISDISFAHGFNDAAHFSRSFRKQYGISARQHRAASQQNPAA